MSAQTSSSDAQTRQLVEFIERYAIDSTVYVVVQGERSDVRYELYWVRESAGSSWSLRRKGSESWANYSASELPAALSAHGVVVSSVQEQLTATALTQVVFAETLSAEARQVFGSHRIEQAVCDHERFLASLRQTVIELTRTELKVVEGGGERSEARTGHLRLVASPTIG